MSLAYPDIADPTITSLQFPILVGGSHMALFRMTAVYFNQTFALLDSVAGLIPRGIWPSDVDDQLFSGFSYTINFASYILIDSELESFPAVDDVFLQPDPTMTLLSTAQSLDDLELTEQIKFSLERDRFEMAEAVATDVVQSVKERFDDFLRLICFKNGPITTPLL